MVSGTSPPSVIPHRIIPIVRSEDAKRLYWVLDGPLTTAIKVMKHSHFHPNTAMEPYHHQNADGTSTWSSISQAPFTEPKVGSLTVHITDLDSWEAGWVGLHSECEDLDESERMMGDLPDYDPEEDEEDWFPEVDPDLDEHPWDDKKPKWLVRCCGHDRPRKKKKAPLLVEASGEFVTVHDYVSAVHPWLLSLREDLLMAMGNLWDSIPLPASTRLVYDATFPSHIRLTEEHCWRTWRQKHQPPAEVTSVEEPRSVLPRGSRRSSSVIGATAEDFGGLHTLMANASEIGLALQMRD